jgi:hypothetical protein
VASLARQTGSLAVSYFVWADWKPAVRDSLEGYPPQREMPDVDCGVAIRHLVDVQQRLNCALPRHFFEPRFAFAIRGLHPESIRGRPA